jgi:anaphase-promoting complex subunit 2
MVSIIGSKDQLVNEYRVMLAEKLLSKSDFDIDSDIRTLELLKVKTNFLISSYLVRTSDWTALDVYAFAVAFIFPMTMLFWQIHFGESSMQKCEIMLNDLIDSKRTNSNIKTSLLRTIETGTYH